MENPIPPKEFSTLLNRASNMLNVHEDQYDGSIRHTVVKETLANALGDDRVRNMPLGVERRNIENSVTWTGTNTVLGDVVSYPGLYVANRDEGDEVGVHSASVAAEPDSGCVTQGSKYRS